jgi:hypothetical protein
LHEFEEVDRRIAKQIELEPELPENGLDQIDDTKSIQSTTGPT